MKIRNGFVSNSSSSSFVIAKNAVTEEQITELIAYTDSEDNHDCWGIGETEWFIRGGTMMDNGAIHEFIRSFDLPLGSIHWEN